jgi:hypothetical protein
MQRSRHSTSSSGPEQLASRRPACATSVSAEALEQSALHAMAGSAEHHAVERGTDAHVFAHRARAVGLFEQLSCTFGAEQLTAYSDTNLQKSMLHAACKNGGAHPCMQTLRVD